MVGATVVQVVTGGTDWPAIVAAISGGLVGLAGIGASIWTVRRGINAADSRANLAEKRRIYAHFQACSNKLAITATSQRKANQPGEPIKAREPALARVGGARDTFLDAYSQVRLLAPDSVVRVADDLLLHFITYLVATDEGASLTADDHPAGAQMSLINVMRADLGEPPSASDVLS